MSKTKIKENKAKDITTFERIEKLLSKNFGEESIKRMSDLEDVPFISSGSLQLDIALKMPFTPGVHMIYGGYGAGKTTLALEGLSAAQQSNHYDVCMYENVERRLNKSQVAMIQNLEADGVLMVNPDTAEDAGDMLVETLRCLGKKERLYAVVDSVAAMEPEVIGQKSFKEATMGLDAKIITTMLRKVSKLAADTGSVIIFINQTRQDFRAKYGNKVKVPGGDALWFYPIQVVYLSVSSQPPYGKRLDKAGNIIGRVIRAEIQKNTWARPFFSVPLPLYFGKGIDTAYEITQLLLSWGLAEQKASWIIIPASDEIKEEIKVQGIEQLAELIREDKELMKKLKKVITDTLPA